MMRKAHMVGIGDAAVLETLVGAGLVVFDVLQKAEQ